MRLDCTSLAGQAHFGALLRPQLAPNHGRKYACRLEAEKAAVNVGDGQHAFTKHDDGTDLPLSNIRLWIPIKAPTLPDAHVSEANIHSDSMRQTCLRELPTAWAARHQLQE